MIRHIMFDYSGVFDKDDYAPVHDVIRKNSSIQEVSEIDKLIGIVWRFS